MKINPSDRAMKILADTHYAPRLRDRCAVLDEMILARYGRLGQRMAGRIAMLRGWMAVRIGRNYELIVTCPSWPGGKWIVLFEALLGKKRRRVMLLEFGTRPKSGWKGIIYPLWLKWLYAPAVRRAVRAAQVMTDWERSYTAELLNVPEERFRFIPWPLSDGRQTLPSPKHAPARKVMSSGRAACDWETLFRAAQGANWSLTVVCGRPELQKVKELAGKSAQVLCDIPAAEHQAMIEASDVYVLCLRNDPTSCGQVRLMNAISAGVPVVATRVRGLEGYATHGTTAMLVEPGDAQGLRGAVDRLLDHPSEGEALSERAFEAARQRTFTQYDELIAATVSELAASSSD